MASSKWGLIVGRLWGFCGLGFRALGSCKRDYK